MTNGERMVFAIGLSVGVVLGAGSWWLHFLIVKLFAG